MKLSTILRHIREGVKNILRNGWMSFASMSSIFISLFVLGFFLLLAMNVNHMADQIESQVQIRVFLKLNVTQEKMTELQNKIGNLTEVKKITFVSKAEGLELLRKNLGEENKDLLAGYENEKNPLPDSFTIEVYNPQSVGLAVEQINNINKADELQPIERVKYGQGTVETLFKVTNALRYVGLVIVIGLAVTAMFLISNTIKMTILARRREIGIMKLVGATNSFIRWPFFIEGALIGIISSIITTVLLLLGYAKLVEFSQMELSLMMIKLVTLQDSGWQIAALIIGLGTVIGVWGSTISIQKYLKV